MLTPRGAAWRGQGSEHGAPNGCGRDSSSELRNVLMPAAEAAADSGLLPLAIVQQIKKGKGRLDMAKDSVALADLFLTNADKLRGKPAISAAQISRAARVGSELIKLVRPKGAKGGRAKNSEKVDLSHARDRPWSLLLLRYDRLERTLAYLARPRQASRRSASASVAIAVDVRARRRSSNRSRPLCSVMGRNREWRASEAGAGQWDVGARHCSDEAGNRAEEPRRAKGAPGRDSNG
jgi:hypothetical protein